MGMRGVTNDNTSAFVRKISAVRLRHKLPVSLTRGRRKKKSMRGEGGLPVIRDELDSHNCVSRNIEQQAGCNEPACVHRQSCTSYCPDLSLPMPPPKSAGQKRKGKKGEL